MSKILIINGPNLNMLGIREPKIYGKESYKDLTDSILEWAKEMGATATCFQSNHEGAIVDIIQEAYGEYDGIVINPAAYTHTSIAIPDAIKAVGIPTVEVHISDISAREDYRKISYTSEACIKTIYGKGFLGYKEAMEMLCK
ncbi:MAG: type II 3-dehydroquinate dehydratase [Anaerovoracaceae bacterium]